MKLRSLLLTIAAITVIHVGSATATTVIGGWTVVDNQFTPDASGQFDLVGSWSTTHDTPQGSFLADINYAIGGGGSNTATWTFKNLPDGYYDVANHWTIHGNRATDSPFSINGGAPIDINQEKTPVGFSLNDGDGNRPFQVLGTVKPVGGQITLQLSDDANQHVIADAAAIRAVPAGSVTLLNATADFSQTGYTVGATTDYNTSSGGWAFHNQLTTNHTAVWETALDLGVSELTFRLSQNLGSNHTLRRLRFSVTQDDRSTFADGLHIGGDITAAWTELTPLTATQLGGSATVNGDNTINFVAPSGNETYTVTAATTFGAITGIRLEVLTDASGTVGYSGTGGNAVLTEFEVEATAVIPEPATMALLGLAFGGLGGYVRKRRRC